MISNNGFSVSIAPSDSHTHAFTRDGAHYVAIRNNVEYAIVLRNNRPTIADAEIFIDGDSIGSFRLEPYHTFRIERPGDNQRKFTFKSEWSRDALEAGATPGASQNGLIRVVFEPAKRTVYAQPRARSPVRFGGPLENAVPRASAQASGMSRASAQASNFSSGVTLLGDRSYQQYGTVTGLRPDQIDRENVTTIMLRLVVDDHKERRYETIAGRSHAPADPRYPPRIDY